MELRKTLVVLERKHIALLQLLQHCLYMPCADCG